MVVQLETLVIIPFRHMYKHVILDRPDLFVWGAYWCLKKVSTCRCVFVCVCVLWFISLVQARFSCADS